jgi:hypothetical protein
MARTRTPRHDAGQRSAELIGGAYHGGRLPRTTADDLLRIAGNGRESWYGRSSRDGQFHALESKENSLPDLLKTWYAEPGLAVAAELQAIVERIPASLWYAVMLLSPSEANYVATWGRTPEQALKVLRTRSDLYGGQAVNVMRFFHEVLIAQRDPSNERKLDVTREALGDASVLRFLKREYRLDSLKGRWDSIDTVHLHALGATSFVVKLVDNHGRESALKCVLPFYTQDVRIETATAAYIHTYGGLSSDVAPIVFGSAARWIHMDFERGETLAIWRSTRIISKKPLRAPPIQDVLAVGNVVSDKLSELHKKFEHLDLSPTNIIAVEGSRLEVRFIDLGINYAAFGAVQGGTASSIYVAPELKAGMHPTGLNAVKSDAYSFGIILASFMLGRDPRDNALPDDFFTYYPGPCVGSARPR